MTCATLDQAAFTRTPTIPQLKPSNGGMRPPTALSTVGGINPPHRSAMLVDGLNTMFSNDLNVHLETLVTVVLDIVQNGYSPIVVFDASTPWKIARHQGPSQVRAYKTLLTYRDHFTQVNGIEADEIILREAEARNAPIVSNDHFRDRAPRFPWLQVKGRLIRVNTVRDIVHVGAQRLRIDFQLDRAMSNLQKALSDRAA
jgi:hypothetical protein